MGEESIIVWFRSDLRLTDNPALCAACKKAKRVILLYIHDPEQNNSESLGAASKWWLHYSLEALQGVLARRKSKLVLRTGQSSAVIKELIAETKSTAVYWNSRYEPFAREQDKELKTALQEQGVDVVSFNAGLLVEPLNIANSSGKPFRVFTHFWKKLSSSLKNEKPLPVPGDLRPPKKFPRSDSLSQLQLLPNIDWAKGLQKHWTPGEQGAKRALKNFIANGIGAYSTNRDKPALAGTSCLSPHLHFGEIGPRQIRYEVEKSVAANSSLIFDTVEPFLRQLGWREFAHHLLFHFPYTVHKPLRAEFENFPWKQRKSLLEKWQQGNTGYPIVDAGMRELWQSGTMHNRVRMVAASFLVKDLLQPWQDGAAWFWDTLVDADLANNTLGWQWVAGCGADAAPYFRVFNPILQGEKFDPQGEYVRRWIPELRGVPAKWIHKPWQCPKSVLEEGGVILGRDYPLPIVDHAEARDEALDAYDEVKRLKRANG